jgi:hypothetical protein
VSAAAWVCDSCDTNNLAQASVCRVCQREPGSTPRQLSVDEIPVRQPTERPIFVDSKHSGPPRPVPPPPEPAYIGLTAAPARGSAPPPREVPRRTGHAITWLVVTVILVAILLVVVLTTNFQAVFGSGTPGQSTPDPGTEQAAAAQLPRSTPCPEAVATWLPSGAVLVAAYTTDRHVVTLCRDSSGQLYYDGQVKGAPASSQTHISLRATATATGFVAYNKGYSYEITGSELIVTNNGTEILRATLNRQG